MCCCGIVGPGVFILSGGDFSPAASAGTNSLTAAGVKVAGGGAAGHWTKSENRTARCRPRLMA
jgi:hypothetical protein